MFDIGVHKGYMFSLKTVPDFIKTFAKRKGIQIIDIVLEKNPKTLLREISVW